MSRTIKTQLHSSHIPATAQLPAAPLHISPLQAKTSREFSNSRASRLQYYFTVLARAGCNESSHEGPALAWCIRISFIVYLHLALAGLSRNAKLDSRSHPLQPENLVFSTSPAAMDDSTFIWRLPAATDKPWISASRFSQRRGRAQCHFFRSLILKAFY